MSIRAAVIAKMDCTPVILAVLLARLAQRAPPTAATATRAAHVSGLCQ